MKMNTGALEKNTSKTQLRRAVQVGGVLCVLIGIITLLTSLSGLFSTGYWLSFLCVGFTLLVIHYVWQKISSRDTNHDGETSEIYQRTVIDAPAKEPLTLKTAHKKINSLPGLLYLGLGMIIVGILLLVLPWTRGNEVINGLPFVLSGLLLLALYHHWNKPGKREQYADQQIVDERRMMILGKAGYYVSVLTILLLLALMCIFCVLMSLELYMPLSAYLCAATVIFFIYYALSFALIHNYFMKRA